MGVNIQNQAGLVVVRIEDRQLTADEQILRISDELNKILESTPTGTRLLVDFQDVELVASLLLGDLVALHKKAARKGVILQFRGFRPDVLRVIRTCKLDSLLDILGDPPSG